MQATIKKGFFYLMLYATLYPEFVCFCVREYFIPSLVGGNTSNPWCLS